MPRPPRIAYEHALYHVMNRGRARQRVFHDPRYYQAFLDTLGEVHARFQGVIHAYCLMGNHYHLMVETPRANLSRIMRHLNGVYTQRHNRLKRTDGPLFRGRYKAILVEQDAYLLQVSRYIHRNPLDETHPLVKNLADYPWSSFPAYIGQVKPPAWLCRDTTYDLLGAKQQYAAYRRYVLEGIDDDTADFYQQGNTPAVMGEPEFKAWIYDDILPELEAEEKSRVLRPRLPMQAVVTSVAQAYRTTPTRITTVIKGPQSSNEARKLAMYLCQELADVQLKDIANYFQLRHVGSVSCCTHQVRQKKRTDARFAARLDKVIKHIINQVN
ncbi:MAG: hypothetical protein NPIRA02_10660 [Nitrospirales bacterium]|nr:MAG: hypothetical protein NPIRA02_10660 [Nitrospirales bacterium]